MSKLSIEVSLYANRPYNEIKRGRLELLCSGDDCNSQFFNGLGRVAVDYVPTYAFAKDLIKIEKIHSLSGYHDSVPFNHDMMRDRLKNIPFVGIDPGVVELHEKYWKDVDYLDPERKIHENEKRIEMSIDSKNTASEEDSEAIIHVTTNDAKVYVDNVLTQPYSKEYPFNLISLKPKEAFKCSMRAVLGVGRNDSCWTACSNFYYDQETIPGKTILKFEGTAQFDLFTLVDRAIECYRSRAKKLKEEVHRLYLMNKEAASSNEFQLIINDEDHTMGEPINYEIQSHPNVLKSSITKPNLLIRKIVFDIVTKKASHMLDALLESFDVLINKINKFETEFKKIPRVKTVVLPTQSSATISHEKKSELKKSGKKDLDKKDKDLDKKESGKKEIRKKSSDLDIKNSDKKIVRAKSRSKSKSKSKGNK